MKSFTKAEVTFHTAVDDSDPGFALKGYKMRWISQVVEVRRAGRMWRTLHISSLPKEAQEKFKQINSGWDKGDTIRRRDLTLAFAPLEEVVKYHKQKKHIQNANEAIFKGTTQDGAIKSTGSMTSERMSSGDFK